MTAVAVSRRVPGGAEQSVFAGSPELPVGCGFSKLFRGAKPWTFCTGSRVLRDSVFGGFVLEGSGFLWGPVYSAGAQYLNLATGSANVLLMLVCPEVEYRLIVGSRAAFVAAGFMPAKMFERSACVDCCFFDFCPAEF